MQPWFKFYAADYLLDDAVFEMPPEAGQLLVLTWCLCWRDGCAPADPDKLARAARLDKRYVRRHFDTVARFFRVENGTLISVRMDRERAENSAKTEIATALARNAANARWSKQSPAKSGNGDARRNASRNADRNACQSQSQNQIEKKSPSDSCAEPAPERRSPPSPDCPEFPTKGPVRDWQATADQVARWRELYPGLDVRHELRKAHEWVLANPSRAKTSRGMAGFVLNWLSRATDRPRNAQPSFAPLPAAPPKPPRVHTRRDLLSQEIRDAEAFKRTDRVAELRRRLAEAERNGTADEPVE